MAKLKKNVYKKNEILQHTII